MNGKTIEDIDYMRYSRSIDPLGPEPNFIELHSKEGFLKKIIKNLNNSLNNLNKPIQIIPCIRKLYSFCFIQKGNH